MKKWLVLIIVVLAMVVVLVPVAFAQGPMDGTFGNGMSGPQAQGQGQGQGQCVNFVDEDGDGVCDLAGTGQGGNGPGYVDDNGDGVCDHAGTGSQQGARRGQGRMRGRGLQ